MLKINRPPQHAPDDEAIYIAPNDPAWNDDMFRGELEKLDDKSKAKHPLTVWYTGATRYSLDAPLTLPVELRGDDGPRTVKVTDYLEAEPTKWVIRPMGARGWREYMAQYNRGDETRELTAVKHGLVEIRDVEGEDGKPTTIDALRGGTVVDDDILDEIDRHSRILLSGIGMAVVAISLQRSDEGKP